jgi:hypothetical protein
MFEKLFLLVKSNAGTAVINNPVIPAGKSEAVINEASSSIIEVLKGQLENGFYIFAIMTKEQIQDLRDRTASLRRHL